MAKITIHGFINYRRPDPCEKDQHGMHFHACDMSEFDYTRVQAHSFEVEIPEDFDPRPGMLKALDKKEQVLKAEFARRMMEIGKARSELLALEAA